MLQSLTLRILAPAVLLAFSSCTSTTTTTTESAENIATAQVAEMLAETDLGHEGTVVSYEDDWAAFKSAIANKNLEGIQYFLTDNVSGAQGILDMMPPEALNALDKAKYKNLEKSDYNGTPVKLWDYQETGVDEEGNEVGMGLFFYFEEQAVGLRMIGLLAAG